MILHLHVVISVIFVHALEVSGETSQQLIHRICTSNIYYKDNHKLTLLVIIILKFGHYFLNFYIAYRLVSRASPYPPRYGYYAIAEGRVWSDSTGFRDLRRNVCRPIRLQEVFAVNEHL